MENEMKELMKELIEAVDFLGSQPSRRERIAIAAMQGYCADRCANIKDNAIRAVMQADALIAELDKEEK